MGARISITLINLLNTPGVAVELSQQKIGSKEDDLDVDDLDVDSELEGSSEDIIEEYTGVAKIYCNLHGVFTFDYSSDNGGVELEADFNFFRNEERHLRLMRALFEYSIPFTVIPG